MLEDGRKALARRAVIRRSHTVPLKEIQQAGAAVDAMHADVEALINSIEAALAV